MIIVDEEVVRRGLLATACGTDRATMDRNVPHHDIRVSLIANLYNDEAHIVPTVPGAETVLSCADSTWHSRGKQAEMFQGWCCVTHGVRENKIAIYKGAYKL
jgi:hypothetical protein